MSRINSIYLIKRGPRPEYHRAPFHPIVICDHLKIAKWEAGWTGEGATVWENCDVKYLSAGWLLGRWKGFDIDYGHVVRHLSLPDGTQSAFCHDRDGEPWALLSGAVWWSERKLPPSLADRGVRYAPDSFTRNRILDHCCPHGTRWVGNTERELKRGEIVYASSGGFNRADEWPDFWPEPVPDWLSFLERDPSNPRVEDLVTDVR